MKLHGRERVFYWLWMIGFALGGLGLGAILFYTFVVERRPVF